MPVRPRVAALAAVALSLLVPMAAPASASPVDDKQRQVQQIADKIDQLGDQAARLGERYNGALVKQAQADQEVAAAEAKLHDLEGRLSSARSAASTFALQSYLYADQTSSLVAVVSGTALSDGAAQRQGYASIALGANSDATDDLKRASEDTEAQRQLLATKQKAAADAVKAVAASKQAALDAQATQEQQLTKAKGELATLVQQEEARRQAEAARQSAIAAEQARQALAAQQARLTAPPPTAAAAPAAAAPTSGTTAPAAAGPGQAAGPTPTATTAPAPKATAAPPTTAAAPDVPPTSARAAIAVRAALSQLGVPYVFNTASPGRAFDCSGLTMWAWAQAGVSMGHYTVWQYNQFPKVPRDQLQPGDLVFFYKDLGHMGMYIGNGMFVQAPRTGDVVKISPLAGRDYAGAVRPG